MRRQTGEVEGFRREHYQDGIPEERSISRYRSQSACENGVVYIPTGLIHQRELDTQIERAKTSLGPEVTHVAYRVGEDSTGAASIFFRITLSDWATAEDVITDVTGRVATILFDQVRPLEDWGLRPYFNFRGDSDQQRRPDPDWI